MSERWKAGANYSDVNRIKAMAAAGSTRDEIAERLLIQPDCVASYMDDARAHDEDGKFTPDDPETPENEAYEQRERGKPSAGKQRRTAAEVAEDEAAKAQEE